MAEKKPAQPPSEAGNGTAPETRKPEPARDGAGEANANELAAAAVLEDLEALRARAQERDEYLDLLQRTRADFANYQKRNQKERDQERRYWNGPLVLDLLPVLDNLERAIIAAQQAGETGPLVQGVAMVQNQVLDILRRHGITPIDALDKPFDPHQHQAVMQQPAPGKPAHTVVQVLERGYMLHDRVLRPAKVAVSTS
jgi:molecular chaperone GrpE